MSRRAKKRERRRKRARQCQLDAARQSKEKRQSTPAASRGAKLKKMTATHTAASIGGLLAMGFLTIALLTMNFVSRRDDLPSWLTAIFAKVSAVPNFFGAATPDTVLHYVLGGFVCFITGLVVVHLGALYAMEVEPEQLQQIKGTHTWGVLGPLFNPFFVSKYAAVNAIGHAFLIVLWWFGMYAMVFAYQLSNKTPFSFGFHSLLSVVYFAMGLSAMLGIQACWHKFGVDAYRLKWMCAFPGILIGMIAPRFLLKIRDLSLLP